jgi:hypothetical protein
MDAIATTGRRVRIPDVFACFAKSFALFAVKDFDLRWLS